MSEIIVATPLSFAFRHPHSFGDGISIRKIEPILWDVSISSHSVSPHELDELRETQYWLCASTGVDRVSTDTRRDLVEKARHAMCVLQIICPSGATNLFLRFEQTDRGYVNTASEHPRQRCSTLIGRLTRAEDRGIAQDFNAVYSSVKRSFAENLVRLQNPILLLEHGQQIGNANLGALMFAMALEMLMMAGGNALVERLGGFLGPQSYVFPPDSIMNRQPSVKVQEVLGDLYAFRNILAHGQEIPERYREEYDLCDTSGWRINSAKYHYAELMCESGLFLLARALRKISTENLFDKVRDEKQWRQEMRRYEHRWKDAATVASPDTRR